MNLFIKLLLVVLPLFSACIQAEQEVLVEKVTVSQTEAGLEPLRRSPFCLWQ